MVAQAEGFHYSTLDKFVQILNIRKNHWITLSNVFCESSEVKAPSGKLIRPTAYAKSYDSLPSLSEKGNDISYLLNVDKCVCELMKPHGTVEIAIENVQQQNGCNDCRLFALVFATALCSNINPNSLVIAQQRLREALMHRLKECDMSYFLQNACDLRSHEFNQQSLFNMRSLVAK